MLPLNITWMVVLSAGGQLDRLFFVHDLSGINSRPGYVLMV